ncbi:MAG TPA: hypothetical protein VEA80_16080 [Vitreimonas sp.]|uniref:hypothetical protein n=1 Tax=Vitreimonas sp. TaxID=3069702 RepID=UPI002D45F23A|nr:hypothetical protein [Vitreimonas sp.]HYD88995.1 hypothetical protein [Vitreimonas sp.]
MFARWDEEALKSETEQPHPISYPSLERVVELARQTLRERGLTDDEIESLLTRTRAPEFERPPH